MKVTRNNTVIAESDDTVLGVRPRWCVTAWRSAIA
jgi:hypothetical protein